jgi:phage/plasmid-associated DNA primase
MDILKDFLEERCDVGDGCNVGNTELYSAFTSWATANGERERSQRWFCQALHDRGFRQDPSRSAGRRWKGLALKRLPVSQDYQQRSAWS